MSEKRILIVPAELTQKINDNRGDMSQGDFIEFLIDSQLKQNTSDQKPTVKYATKEEIQSLEQDIKRLLKTFLDFFLIYGLEIGKDSQDGSLEEITTKLQGLQKDIDRGEKGRATIKWK